MDLEHLPIIDWELALKAANHKKELAEEILQLIMKNLPNDMALIKQLFHEQKYDDLLKHVHKLHGALCYCGLPRLKTVVKTLESELKDNITSNLSTLLFHLEIEISLLFKNKSGIPTNQSISTVQASIL